MLQKSKNKYPYQLILVEFGIYIFSILAFIFITRLIFTINKKLPDNILMAIYISIFILSLGGLSLFLFCDYKYNQLKIKKIFIIIFFAILISNIISTCCLSSVVNLPYNATLIITASDRLYSFLYGIILGLLPFLGFYALPRKFRHKEYIELLLILVLIVVSISFICGLILDFQNYTQTIKSKFGDMTHPCTSFFAQKNMYGRFIFCGIVAAIFLHIYTNKWYWLLFLIPFMGAEVFSFAKMPLFISILLLIAYLIIRLIPIIKKSKDNSVIFLSLIGALCVFATIISVFIAYSETGILYSVKKALINFGSTASSTIKTRLVIWDCTFKIMKPFQYIFGFSYALFGSAIHNVYDTRHLEETTHIWTAHNSFIEMIAEGGVIYLLINLLMFYWIIKASIKVIKTRKYLGTTNIVIVTLLLIQGITDSLMIFNEGDYLLISTLIIIPVMAEYYNHFDNDENKIRTKMIKDSKLIAKQNYKSKILRLNQKIFIKATNLMKMEYKEK